MGIGLGQTDGVQIKGQQAGFGGGPAAGIAVGVGQVLVQIAGAGQIQARQSSCPFSMTVWMTMPEVVPKRLSIRSPLLGICSNL